MNLLFLVAFLAVLLVIVAISAGAIYAPSLVREYVGNAGIAAATLVLGGFVVAVILFDERNYDWLYHRYKLSDQSPSSEKR